MSALGVSNAVFVGWSLGGHLLLEASELLPRAAGHLVFGAPPVASLADFARATSDDPAFGPAFREESSDDEVRALVSRFVRPGHPAPDLFFDDFRRTDPRARACLSASAARGELRDEVRIVAQLTVPLAVLHGVHDSFVKRPYFDELSMPTLWRGAVQDVPDAGHAPHGENPDAFNRLVEAFATDCAVRA